MMPKERLQALFRTIMDEVTQNPGFAERIAAVLNADSVSRAPRLVEKEKKRNRSRAVLDPINLARQSPQQLRSRLEVLNLEQLRDIVSEFGMDPGRLVAKWKRKDRVIEHIEQMALQRAKKGDSFSVSREKGGDMENEAILRRLGFVEIPRRMLWVSHDRRMAFSAEALSDMDSAWINRHVGEQVPETDFVFHLMAAPKDINKLCTEILNEIGLPRLQPHVRLATLHAGS
jgi:hypothetical protein